MNTSFMARAAAVAVAVAALGGAASMAANAAPGNCSSGTVCIYDNINYGTQLGWRSQQFLLQNVSAGNNDRMSSWSNNSLYNACWYAAVNGGGASFQMNQYTDNPDVGFLWQDNLSSWKGSSC